MWVGIRDYGDRTRIRLKNTGTGTAHRILLGLRANGRDMVHGVNRPLPDHLEPGAEADTVLFYDGPLLLVRVEVLFRSTDFRQGRWLGWSAIGVPIMRGAPDHERLHALTARTDLQVEKSGSARRQVLTIVNDSNYTLRDISAHLFEHDVDVSVRLQGHCPQRLRAGERAHLVVEHDGDEQALDFTVRYVDATGDDRVNLQNVVVGRPRRQPRPALPTTSWFED